MTLGVFLVALGFTILLAGSLQLCLLVDKRRRFWKDRNFPCTGRSRILVGDYGEANRTKHMQEINQELYREFKRRGLPLGGTILFIIQSVIVVDLELVKSILVKDFSNFHDRGIYNNPEVDPISGHLFALEGSAWRQLRMKLSPTFTSGKMKMMFETILGVADDLVSFLKEKSAGRGSVELEMKNVLAGYTADVIGSCAFGVECNSLRSERCKYRETANVVLNQTAGQILWTMLLMLFKPVASALKLKMFSKNIEAFYTDLVCGTIQHREQNKVQRNDFMNLLIQLKNSANPEERITINEIVAQAFVFFFAGFETSSTTMVNCLFELARNQEIQEKLRSEILKTCGTSKITYEMATSIEYLNMVVDETLRKYPAADSLLRKCNKTYFVPDTELKLPEGTFIIIPVYAIHHDPQYYPNPERFDPDRFSAANRASRHPFAYLPFGEGPRNCIGMRFGLMQTRVGLINILRNFRIRPSPSTPDQLKVNPASGLPVPLGGVNLIIERIGEQPVDN
ncbi:cytochrome P450 6a2-like [Uranotaenia lowii]|uniref:cytochrome P450 6a2-like n=1 Tax=Uranotaenia lowii TaxID=190385 RepID=UPI002479C67B|nr:cytochrome P450 6a2-like [Uranotaenia lowii]